MRKLLYIIIGCFICAFLGSLTACKSKSAMIAHESNDSVIHDTLRQYVSTIDTVIRYDSIVIRQNGDTVSIDKWHTIKEYHNKVDTLYITKYETIVRYKDVPVEVKKIVHEKYVPTIVKILAWIGCFSLVTALVFMIAIIKKK